MTVESSKIEFDKTKFRRWLYEAWPKIPQVELVVNDEVVAKNGEHGIFVGESTKVPGMYKISGSSIGFLLHELRKQEIVEQERYSVLLNEEQKRNPGIERTVDDYNRIKMQVMWEVGNESEYLLIKSTLERDS